ncbi:poly-gamma-glutamate capsule biosynthesis protein [Streptosporangium jomthongense]|uniref:CapA family protein n=1 Tax=Marinobacter aromaticivorans TaxID=1494078 RepID=A0ABW2IWH9_9GAMM|nr:CapA family protein [Marinobacter aromaticivorans]GGE72204.1 poly-gamma-glutamate capsule biosynthesis protein [Streptosporangium jomthongense]
MDQITKQELRISAVGDISMGDHPVCAGHGMRAAFERKKDDILKQVKPYLETGDITLGNLETVVSDAGLNPRWLPSYEMRGDPASLKYLKNSGIDLLGVANNHAMQHGLVAFQDSLVHLQRYGFGVIGVDQKPGQTKPYVFQKSGVAHTFFALSMRPEKWHDGTVPYSLRDNHEKVLAEVTELKKNCEGFLVCSIHWGLELLDYPGPDEIRLGRALIDAGVDVVVGHHSHLLWPIERYKNGLIFYSLGNFVFDLWARDTKLSVIADICLREGEAPDYSLIPVVIGEDFTVAPADATASREILARLSENSQPVNMTAEEYEQNHQAAVKIAKPIKYKYFLRNFYRYSPGFFFQSLFRTLLRRLSGD